MAIHGPLDKFGLVDLPLNRTAAPGKGQCRPNGVDSGLRRARSSRPTKASLSRVWIMAGKRHARPAALVGGLRAR